MDDIKGSSPQTLGVPLSHRDPAALSVRRSRSGSPLHPDVVDAIAVLAEAVVHHSGRARLATAYLPRVIGRLFEVVDQWHMDVEYDCPVCATPVTMADRNYCPECGWKEKA